MTMDTSLDTLISAAVTYGTNFVVAPAKRRPWTAEDDAYLRRYAGLLTDEQIAASLGRTEVAVHVRRVRLMLPARQARPF